MDVAVALNCRLVFIFCKGVSSPIIIKKTSRQSTLVFGILLTTVTKMKHLFCTKRQRLIVYVYKPTMFTNIDFDLDEKRPPRVQLLFHACLNRCDRSVLPSVPIQKLKERSVDRA